MVTADYLFDGRSRPPRVKSIWPFSVPLPILAKSKSNIEDFAGLKKGGKTMYQAAMIGNAAAGITSLADVAGKDFVFGDPDPPPAILSPNRCFWRKEWRRARNIASTSSAPTMQSRFMVQAGKAQAGGLSKPIFETLVERGIVDPKKVVVLAVSSPIRSIPGPCAAI